MIKIIEDKSELRTGNLIFVDDIVFPPNFICAQPRMLGEGFEDAINKDWDNCAFLNISDQYAKDLFGDELKKNGIKLQKIQDAGFDTLPKWRMFDKDHDMEISFIHQIQNNFKDWTGIDLIK